MRILMLGIGLLLTGCATTSQPASSACLDGDGSISNFHVASPRTVMIEQPHHRRYRVELSVDCPGLESARSLSVSSGFARIVSYDHLGRPIWGETRSSLGRVCPKPGDALVMREDGEEFDHPARRCKIAAIDAIP